MNILCYLVLISTGILIGHGISPPIEEQWAQCSLDYEKYSWPLKDTLIELLRNVSSDTTIKLTSECREGLEIWSGGIINRSMWAYQRKLKLFTTSIVML